MKPGIIYLFLILIILSFGCKKRPKEIKEALNLMSYENKMKFESVFEHFSQPKDSLKLKAAYFLVANMDGLGFYKGSQIEDYNQVFTILANKPADYRENLPWYSDDLVSMFDSLRNIYGPMDYKNLYFVKDENAISSDYMIKYINDAFDAWHNPWSVNVVSFPDFCNYVLPYRNLKEPLEDWREMFVEKFNWIHDSVKKSEDILDVARRLNVNSELKFSNGFGAYIVSIPPSFLLNVKYGDCSNSSNYKAMIMRSFGIPVAIDFIPLYGSDHNVHFWNSVMDRNGNFVSFEEALQDINAFVAYKYKLCKIFRKTFTKNNKIEALISETKGDVPNTFNNSKFIDVTPQYVAVTDVKLQLDKVPHGIKYVYVSVFNDAGWTPVDFAKIVNNSYAQFSNLGRDVLYLPTYFINGQIKAASLPFKISKKGYIQYLEPQKENTTVKLTRKYHMYQNKVNWLKCLTESWFEGANKRDFSDAITLARINKTPGEHFQELVSNSNKSFKYLRLVFSSKESNITYDGDGASIAEIEFLDTNGKILKGKAIGTPGRKYNIYTPTKCFDSNPLTFFEDARPLINGKYVGLELSLPAQVSKIRFLPRNDMNSVQSNNNYELLYWNNEKFISLGKKIATDTIIEFNNVPKNSVLWLRNLDVGKEERIFTWENGKQVWW